MSLVVAWLVFPAVALLVVWGCGLLVERAAGRQLPLGALLGLGMALVMVIATIGVLSGTTAPLVVPAVVVTAVAGLALSRRTLRRPVDPWGFAAVAGVFGVYALPIVLSGDATFAGYTVLGDTAVQFIAADHLLQHGYDLSTLPASNYRSTLSDYFVDGGYPVGSQLAAGVLRALVGADIAWVYQPFLALLGALFAAAIWVLTADWIPSRPMRALVAFISAQPALFYAYALQGSIKEIGAAWIIALLAALLPWWREACAEGPRRVIPLAVAAAASVAILGFAIAPWLAPLLLLVLLSAVAGGRLRGRALLVSGGAFVGLTVVLAAPVLRSASAFSSVTTEVVTAQREFGNLLGDLNPLQVFGVWLTGDYRLPPIQNDLVWTHLLLGVAIVALIVAAVWAIRERRWLVVGLAATMGVACLYITANGSPWADGKALAITAPFVLLAAMLGAAALARAIPVAGWAVALALAGGVVTSNALAYHAAVLAPRDRLEELAGIGERYAGAGPILAPDKDDFSRHFLREGDPWVADGQKDVDQLPVAGVEGFRTLVRRGGPMASRPPASFRLVRSGRWYEVWQRDPGAPPALAHIPLGTASSSSSVPACAEVRRLARRARAQGADLAGAPRAEPLVFRPARLDPLPIGWARDGNEPEVVTTPLPGVVKGAVTAPRAGRYALHLEGSFGRRVAVSIDGRRVAEVAGATNYRGQSEPLGTVELTAGEHTVEVLRDSGRKPRPGWGGVGSRIGRLWLDPAPQPTPVVRVAPRDAERLCGRALDWIEVLPKN